MSTLLEEEVEITTKDTERKAIVIYNDNVNTFEFVIALLIKYCHHSDVQAEQCAHIIHFNGKCDVKRGYYKDLKPICQTLAEKGLKAKIE
jgi:ATP-dependent Clp protease adaptor protein ClpS